MSHIRQRYADGYRIRNSRDHRLSKVCGVPVETIEDPMMRDLRILDKLVDELAKGWQIEKITGQ